MPKIGDYHYLNEKQSGFLQSISEHEDSDYNVLGIGVEATETNEFEPPSAEFSDALEKEKVYYSFLIRGHETDQMEVIYNNWESETHRGHATMTRLMLQIVIVMGQTVK